MAHLILSKNAFTNELFRDGGLYHIEPVHCFAMPINGLVSI